MSEEKLVRVYRARGEAEAMVIKGLLDSNGIPSLVRSNAAPSVHVFSVDGMGKFEVVVPASYEQQATALLRGEDV